MLGTVYLGNIVSLNDNKEVYTSTNVIQNANKDFPMHKLIVEKQILYIKKSYP